MKSSKKSANPFYILLVAFGLTFVVTATAYGVMAFRESRAAVSGSPSIGHPLMEWMNRHGNTALMVELVLLGISTVAAIGTDDYWQRRAARSKAKHSEKSTG
jgi:hypothetical protein